MPRELALIRWTDRNIVLDPNLDDFGVPTWVIHELRGAPGQKPKSIPTGTLECERCLESPDRSSAAVHLRRSGDRLIVAHNASKDSPCYKPESPEHLALKDRVMTSAERHGFHVQLETSTADRKGRADVEVIGPNGQRIGHEIQLSPVNNSVLTRRNNTALRDGRTPSWLTTDQSAHSATRNLIDRVPWAMSNRLHVELIRKGRPLRVSAGLSKLRIMRCRDLPGLCPDDPRTRFCSSWHTRWENVAEQIEDFVGHTATGTYLPVSLPTQYREVRRRWITPADRELYAHATGIELQPERPEATTPHDLTSTGRSRDSRLHQGEKHEPKKKQATRPRARVSEVVRGEILVGTIRHLPAQAQEEQALTGKVTTSRVLASPPHALTSGQAEQTWLEAALPIPCNHYMGPEMGTCESTPSRSYARGRRCYEHAPNAFKQAR